MIFYRGFPHWVLFLPESKPTGNLARMFYYRPDLFQGTFVRTFVQTSNWRGGGHGIFREVGMEVPGDSLDSMEGVQHPFCTVEIAKTFFDWSKVCFPQGCSRNFFLFLDNRLSNKNNSHVAKMGRQGLLFP